MSLETFLLLQATLLGLAIGSFLNVVIYRLPQQQSLGGRSHCPHCQAKIPWYCNIPVISFIVLRAQCYQCKQKISLRYPLIEILTAVLSILLIQHVHFEITAYLLWFCFFICPLIVISFIDIDHQIIPDVISLPGIIIGILVTQYLYWPHWQTGLSLSSLGILVGGGSLLLLSQAYYYLRGREGMGGGDIKLAAMFGAFLGWQAVVLIFFFSSLLALLFVVASWPFRTKQPGPIILPYGPFLCLAAMIQFFWGQKIMATYIKLAF